MNKLTLKNSYTEDVSLVGTTILSIPAVVYDMTISLEGDGDAVVSIADATTYSSTSRVIKATTTAEVHTVHLVYPEGKIFSSGISAIANIGSVDIAITYE